MVRIRLRRMGAKKSPFYRIVVANQRNARDGRFIETIGTYNPLIDPPSINLKADRAAYWLSNGAQPSDALTPILVKEGVIDASGKVIYQPAAEEPVAEEVAA